MGHSLNEKLKLNDSKIYGLMTQIKWERGLAGVPHVGDTRWKMKGSPTVERCWNKGYDSGSIVMTSGQRPKF